MKCPYCNSGMKRDTLAASGGQSTFREYPCESCDGTGAMVCLDAAGVDITRGDTVTLTLRLDNIRRKNNPHTGVHDRSDVELSLDGPEGSRIHFCVLPSTAVKKA